MTRSIERLLSHQPIMLVYLAPMALLINPLLALMTGVNGNIPATILWTVAFLGSLARVDNWLVYEKPEKEAPALTLWVGFIGSLGAVAAMICTFVL